MSDIATHHHQTSPAAAVVAMGSDNDDGDGDSMSNTPSTGTNKATSSANHGEQQRRKLLKDRLMALRDRVPVLKQAPEPGAKSMRSEAVILQKTVEHVNALIQERQQLRELLRAALGPDAMIDSDPEDAV